MSHERSESDWADEHPEYDIDSEDFPSRVGEMAQPIYLWDIDSTREQLEAAAPHRIYVIDVYSRVQRLVNILRSLSTVEKVLSFELFPVETPDGKIHREAWLRVAIDAYLARITAIRDCLFLLTATVFELNLADRDVNFMSLKKNIRRADVVDLLQKIAATGRDTRDERDLKFHRGIEREFDEMGLYRSMSFVEMYGSDGKVQSHPPGGPTWDLKAVHQEAVSTIRTEMRAVAQALIELTLDLFDLLLGEYDRRWTARRDRATSVRDWERV